MIRTAPLPNIGIHTEGRHRSRQNLPSMNSRARCGDPLFRIDGVCTVPCPQHAPAQYATYHARHKAGA